MRGSIHPLLLALTLICSIRAADVRVMSGNFVTDIIGVQDVWLRTWGKAGSILWPIAFKPPAGQRVLIHSIRGDLVAWSRTSYTGARDKFGVLAAFQTRKENTGGGGLCDWCDISTLLYVQAAAASKDVAQRQFSIRFTEPQALPVRTLFVKASVWLSDVPGPVHIEVTYTVEFEFAPETVAIEGGQEAETQRGGG